jgi:hypothetical protein
MSRSNPNNSGWVENPATTVQWGGAATGVGGSFHTYDSDLGERNQIKLPFKFAWLDEKSAVEGYSEKLGSYVSNEVSNLKEEPLMVYACKKGEGRRKIAAGLYENIKSDLAALQARYTTVIYGMVLSGCGSTALPPGTLVRILLQGSAVAQWMSKGFSAKTGSVEVNSYLEKTKGIVTYRCPVFTGGVISDKENDMATETDVKLQEYFKLVRENQAAMDSAQQAQQEQPSDEKGNPVETPWD